ncbi:cobyric acid synthase [Salininema proteolyticum]|uniref:Cobyric acid synthase n=1 Tax=Salininema proteolyticum TaxID=1607685 RepID=A0ABV8U5I6_9ACTN
MNRGLTGSLLVAGTTSDAGKSVLVAGLCRLFARRGISVAPFKAQNMALNAAVTPEGGEIGRAQAAQAHAAGVEPHVDMNPILIKPTGERHSQVVVRGKAAFEAGARDYHGRKKALLPVVAESFANLENSFDLVIAEGAGGAAEINLRPFDLTNLGLARECGLPVVIVCDIDRGGAFAALYGTLALLEPEDQALVCGFVINRFRGDRAVLDPGIEQLEILTGRPCLGVVPHVEGLMVDAEDSLALDRSRPSTPPLGRDGIDVAVVRFPRISNFTDLDALAAEPGVRVSMTADPAEVAEADLVVVPGTKNTVADLEWMRGLGIDAALEKRAALGGPILGVCGGYQILGEAIDDDVESGAGLVRGLGLLPVETVFHEEKTLRRHEGRATVLGGPVAGGYSIRHGRPKRLAGDAWLVDGDGAEEGCVVDAVHGTSWHGLFENDDLRRAFLGEVARRRGLDFTPGDVDFARLRSERVDAFADVLEEHLDTAALEGIISNGPPPDLPVAPPGGAPLTETLRKQMERD